MIYGSVCSGVEAATAAWHQLGWTPAWFSEVENFPCAVLAHHYPDVPNHGDMTKLRERNDLAPIDVLVGGTPCQSFSVAGLRRGLDDERGNLAIEYVRLADHLDPRYAVWENVPGVLSDKGNAFGCFLGALAGEDGALEPPGGKWTNAGYVLGPKRNIAWRVLDAQWFGVAQRRRRVFLVACPRNGADPREILFERESVRRDSPPSRETGQTAPTIPARSSAGGGLGTNFDCDGGLQVFGGNRTSGSCDVAPAVNARGGTGRMDFETEAFVCQGSNVGAFGTLRAGNGHLTGGVPFVTHSLRADGFDASEDGTGRGTPLVPVAFMENQRGELRTSETIGALGRGGGKPGQGYPAVTTLALRTRDGAPDLETRADGTANAVLTPNGGRGGIGVGAIHYASGVRRLTPRECERLQGFPDDYTLVTFRNKPAADGPRYKAIGNSMAVPCMLWIGRRIELADILR